MMNRGPVVFCLRFFTTDARNAKPLPFKRRNFIDSLRVFVRAGAGGQGLPKYGGVGGNGGNVIVVADANTTLKIVHDRCPQKRYTAGTGANSKRRCLLGEAGTDLEVRVPVGVTVKTDAGRCIGDLNEDEQTLVVATGGTGGHPGNNFLGRKGEARSVVLDLKLIADIGLVGFPNAGKSTFLSAVSRTKPKIAEYPFTTIMPQVGTMEYSDFRKITLADLPGLIEGAHVNVGMGHKFLKHVERTKLLLFMVDVTGFQLGAKYLRRSAFETVLLLNRELELYRHDLVDKPAVLVVNKTDLDEGGLQTDHVMRLIKGLPETLSTVDPSIRPESLVKFEDIFTISAKYGESVDQLKSRLRELLDVFADMKDFQQEQRVALRNQRPVPDDQVMNTDTLV